MRKPGWIGLLVLLLLSGCAVYIAFRFMGRNEQALL